MSGRFYALRNSVFAGSRQMVEGMSRKTHHVRLDL